MEAEQRRGQEGRRPVEAERGAAQQTVSGHRGETHQGGVGQMKRRRVVAVHRFLGQQREPRDRPIIRKVVEMPFGEDAGEVGNRAGRPLPLDHLDVVIDEGVARGGRVHGRDQQKQRHGQEYAANPGRRRSAASGLAPGSRFDCHALPPVPYSRR